MGGSCSSNCYITTGDLWGIQTNSTLEDIDMKFLRYVLCAFAMILCLNINTFADGADYYARVILVGNYRCGKTALFNRMFSQDFDEETPVSDRMIRREIKKTVNGKTIQFNVWDTAGAREFYDEVVAFTKDANFVFIVHDTSSVFDSENEEYLNKLYRDIYGKIKSDGKIVIVGSKWDLRHNNITNASKQQRLLEGVAKSIPCACVFVSAKESGDSGIRNLLNYLEKAGNMNLPSANPDSAFEKKFTIKKGWCQIL